MHSITFSTPILRTMLSAFGRGSEEMNLVDPYQNNVVVMLNTNDLNSVNKHECMTTTRKNKVA